MKRRAIAAVVILAFAATTGLLALAQKPKKKSPYRGLTPAEARALERLVDDTVLARGVVESASNIELRCELPGGSRILDVVADGTPVRKGDVLVRLDSSALSEKVAQRKIAVLQAESALRQAEKGVEVAKLAAEQDEADAKRTLEAAELALREYIGKAGQYEFELKSVEGVMEVAAARRDVAEKMLQRLQKLKKQGAVDETRLDEAQLAMLEARAAVRTAMAKRQVLVQYTLARRKAELEAAVEKAQGAVARSGVQAEAALLKAQSQRQSDRAALELEKERLEQLNGHLAKAVIAAPRDGVVLHSNFAGRRTGSVAIEAGATVSEQQPILVVSDLSRLRVRVLVAEVDVDRIAVGQPVKIRLLIDGVREFRGKVLSVANQPEQRSWFETNVQEYAVIVSIEKPAAKLKIGMTAAAEIDVSD